MPAPNSAPKRRYSTRDITNHLRELAAQAHDWTEADGVITKGEAMARLLWKKALGWKEERVDDEGETKVVDHAPEAWAIQMIYDRIEGKTPQAIEEDDSGARLQDRVSDLAKARVNDLAEKLVGKPGGPPTLPPKKPDA